MTPLILTPAQPLDLSERALTVAPRLLGATLSHGSVSILLTEVEAYEGTDDPASHAWRGPTPRSQIMFGPSGRVYVYLSYGVHHAMNLVCGEVGTASAVLLRAGRVISGIPDAFRGRPGVAAGEPHKLARGPGNLTRALGIDLGHNGEVLEIVTDEESVPRKEIHPAEDADPVLLTGPRVGVSRAADRPWRFWWAREPSVSGYRSAKL